MPQERQSCDQLAIDAATFTGGPPYGSFAKALADVVGSDTPLTLVQVQKISAVGDTLSTGITLKQWLACFPDAR